MPSEQLEEYLESIVRLEERGERITTSSLARERKVSPPSATGMLGRLSDLGLVTRRPRGEVTLTEEGRAMARGVVRRHRLWERFLHDFLGIGLDRVHGEACRLEHATSAEVETELARMVGDGSPCPHGHLIPPALGAPSPGPAETPVPCTSLADLAPGETGTIETLMAGNSFVSHCLALGFTPGTEVAIIRNTGGGPLVVLVRDTRVALGRGEARKIQVARRAPSVD